MDCAGGSGLDETQIFGHDAIDGSKELGFLMKS